MNVAALRAARFSPMLGLALLTASPALAGELAGCWEGTVGDARTTRQAFLDVPSDGSAATLHLFDGEITEANGSIRFDGGKVTAQFSRPDRKLEVELTLDAVADTLEGRLADAERGSMPGSFRRVEPYPDAARFLGTWSGRIEAFGLTLRLHVGDGPCGRLVATLDSPDQGAAGLPCTSISIRERTLEFGVTYLGAAFVGTLDPNGRQIAGTFEQNGATLPFVLARGDAVPAFVRPQEPKPPFPYATEEVRIENAAADLTLAGSLTLPAGDGPHPAAIFISGSGAQDRDEQIMGHKPFLLLADLLTRNGIAVLRTDDRGIGGSGGNPLQSTLQDFAGDVAAQIVFLKQRPEIDPTRIGLLGHSEGGWVAPIVANRVAGLAFMVMLAGPGIGGEELLQVQSAAALRASGVADGPIGIIRRYNAMVYSILKRRLDDEATLQAILAGWTTIDSGLSESDRAAVAGVLGLTPDGVEGYFRAQLPALGSAWFRYLLEFDPGDLLKQLDLPVLALLGNKDVQVPPDPNAVLLRKYLRADERPQVTVTVLPGLNHLMQQADTGLMHEYASIEETINPQALDAIRTWLDRTLRRTAAPAK